MIHCGCLEYLPRGLNKCSDLDSPADTDVRVISVLRFQWRLSSPSTSTLQPGRIRESRCAERTFPHKSRDFVARCAIASCPDARAPSRRVCDAMITDFAQVFCCPAPFITHTPEISKEVRSSCCYELKLRTRERPFREIATLFSSCLNCRVLLTRLWCNARGICTGLWVFGALHHPYAADLQ